MSRAQKRPTMRGLVERVVANLLRRDGVQVEDLLRQSAHEYAHLQDYVRRKNTKKKRAKRA